MNFQPLKDFLDYYTKAEHLAVSQVKDVGVYNRKERDYPIEQYYS